MSSRAFYTAEWLPAEDEVPSAQPSEVLAIEALDLGSTAWEDEGTHKWPLYIDRNSGTWQC